MAQKLDPQETASFKELLISEMIQSEALIRLLVKKGLITQAEYTESLLEVKAEYEARGKS